MKSLYLILLSFFTITSFAQSSFLVKPETRPIANRSVITPIIASIAYQGYDESQAYFGEGEYEIFLDTTDGILDLPIIVLDGFDPGDGRDITALYNSLNFGGDNMADILRDEGYDIIVLNAPQYTTDGKDIDGGADYIQRNAMVLVELINEINAQKVGDVELAILGPSMGGLIARYALAYMEQNSLPTETRLYISFDSPHRGANIPISLQYLVNYLAQELGDPDAVAIIDGVLNSPAAKEMLYDHLLGHLESGSPTQQDPTLLLPLGAPDFRDAFQAELDAIGFPQQVRNVAMVNGSALGNTTGTAGMQVIDTNIEIATFTTADVRLHFTPDAGQVNNVTFFETFLLGLPIASYSADAEAESFTDGVDASPGGTGNISAALGGGGSTNPVIVEFIEALDQDEYSFIPLISSLAIDNEDDWFAIPDIGGTHSSPFVNTYIPDVNEPHVTVTEASAQFALDEIRIPIAGIDSFSASERYMLIQNPVKDQLRLQLNNSLETSTIELRIHSMTGQELMTETIRQPGNRVSLDLALDAGIYLLAISDATGSYTMKFIVK